MDIIIFDRDIHYSIKIMNEISKLFDEYRVVYITDKEDEFKEYIKSNLFDVAIFEEYFINYYSEILKYQVQKICLLEKYMPPNGKYIGVSRNSKKALYNNLSKILLKHSENSFTARELIVKELEYLGYNFSLRGTRYLEDAINLIYLKNCDCNLEREVYAQLSKTYLKTAHNIKVNIQNSTNSMIKTFGYDNVLEYLGIDSFYGVGTKAIICAILNKIKNNIEE